MHSADTIFWWALGSGWVLGYIHRSCRPLIKQVFAELRQGLDR
jgi:hypothetical protein